MSTSRGTYEIVIWDPEAVRWDPYLAGDIDANAYDSRDAAIDAVASLRELDEYADARIGVRPCNADPRSNMVDECPTAIVAQAADILRGR